MNGTDERSYDGYVPQTVQRGQSARRSPSKAFPQGEGASEGGG